MILHMLLQKSQVIDGEPLLTYQASHIFELVYCLFPTSTDSAESNLQWIVSTISVIP